MAKKKIAISITYKGETEYSLTEELNSKEEQVLIELIRSAAQGKLEYLTFEIKDGNVFYPEEILKNSIIKIHYR